MKNILLRTDKKMIPVRAIFGGIAVLVMFYMPYYLMPVFALIAAAIFTMSSGLEIDRENNRIRSYFSSLGIRSGKWGRFDIYKVITIKKQRKGVRIYGGRTSSNSIDRLEDYYDVFLSSENFRVRLLLFTSKSLKESQAKAERWARMFDFPVVKYAPQPSQRTQERRLRHRKA